MVGERNGGGGRCNILGKGVDVEKFLGRVNYSFLEELKDLMCLESRVS